MSSLRDRIAAKREKIADKSAGFVRPYKFQNGKTYFRLLPGTTEPEEFFEEIGIHWIKGPDGKVITTVGDRQICYGEPCPVRESIEQFMNVAREAGDDDALKRAKDMMAKSRYFANIVVVKAPGEHDPKKAVLAEFPETAWDALLSIIEEHIEELAEDADLTKEGPLAFKNGLTFVIERSGSGIDTSYTVMTAAKNIPVAESVMGSATDLSSYKRSQFDERQGKAISALAAMSGLDPSEIAKRLGKPSNKALTGPAASAADEDDDLVSLDDDTDDLADLETETDEEEVIEAEVLSEEDILADLADI